MVCFGFYRWRTLWRVSSVTQIDIKLLNDWHYRYKCTNSSESRTSSEIRAPPCAPPQNSDEEPDSEITWKGNLPTWSFFFVVLVTTILKLLGSFSFCWIPMGNREKWQTLLRERRVVPKKTTYLVPTLTFLSLRKFPLQIIRCWITVSFLFCFSAFSIVIFFAYEMYLFFRLNLLLFDHGSDRPKPNIL